VAVTGVDGEIGDEAWRLAGVGDVTLLQCLLDVAGGAGQGVAPNRGEEQLTGLRSLGTRRGGADVGAEPTERGSARATQRAATREAAGEDPGQVIEALRVHGASLADD
jgi:hypothetical protein